MTKACRLFRKRPRSGIAEELGDEFTHTRNNPHQRSITSRTNRNDLVARDLFEAAHHATRNPRFWRISILAHHQVQRLTQGENTNNHHDQIEARIKIIDTKGEAINATGGLTPNHRNQKAKAKQHGRNTHRLAVRCNQQDCAQNRSHHDVTLSKQCAKVAQVRAKDKQSNQRHANRKTPTNKGGRIGQ